MELPDVELLRLARAGDPAGNQAFHRLIDRHAPALLRLARTLVPTAHDAEDLLQETFLAAFNAAQSFQQRSSVKTWLYAILFRQASLLRRKRGIPTSSLLEDASVSAPSHTAQTDARLDLHAALALLPEPLRAILILRELDGLSYDEIAALLQLPKGTVESRLHRARLALHQILLPPASRPAP